MLASIEFVYYSFMFIIGTLLFIMLPFAILHVIITAPFYVYLGYLELKGIVPKNYYNNLDDLDKMKLPYRFVFAKIFHRPFHY